MTRPSRASSPGPTVRRRRGRRRVVVLSRNPIAEAIDGIARRSGVRWSWWPRTRRVAASRVAALALRAGDAVVLCDHDAPDAPQVLRDALASRGVVRRDDGQPAPGRGPARRPRRGGRARPGAAARAGRASTPAARRPARSRCPWWPRSWPRATAAPAVRCGVRRPARPPASRSAVAPAANDDRDVVGRRSSPGGRPGRDRVRGRRRPSVAVRASPARRDGPPRRT